MSWCRQAISHYLIPCWLRSRTPYGVAEPQWVNTLHTIFWNAFSQKKHFVPVDWVTFDSVFCSWGSNQQWISSDSWDSFKQTKLTHPTMHQSHVPQCTIQNRNVHISVALWEMGQMHCRICEIGLLIRNQWWAIWLIHTYIHASPGLNELMMFNPYAMTSPSSLCFRMAANFFRQWPIVSS